MKSRTGLWTCALLLTLGLSACGETILDSAAEDPVPSTTANEENSSGTIAQLSTDLGRTPLPHDLILGSLNEQLEVPLTGVSTNMPLRIPFGGELADLYDADGNLNPTAGAALLQNVLIFSTAAPTAPVWPLPTHDQANNAVSIGGATGTFKAVYQDANHDLVLVPSANTFADNQTYVVAIKADLKDATGAPLQADILVDILVGPHAIVEDGRIVNTLVRELYKDEADGGLASATALDDVRSQYHLIAQGLTQGESAFLGSYRDLAQLFTFRTEAVDPTVAAQTQVALAAAQTEITDTSSAAATDILWDSTSTLEQATPATDNVSLADANLRDEFLNALEPLLSAQGVTSLPTTALTHVHKGYFPCLNFLANTGTDTAPQWELDLANRAAAPVSDCPNSVSGMTGKLGFWVARPESPRAVAIFVHGITRDKTTAFAIANTLASFDIATVAMDIWGHGERTYEDGNQNGALENTVATAYADSGRLLIRPDNPSLSVGYAIQTQLDFLRLALLLQANSEMFAALGFQPTADSVHIVGNSLGGFIGANLISPNFPANRFVLNATGGDLSDTALNLGGTALLAQIASAYSYDLTTTDGVAALNSTMLGVELGMSHAFAAGQIDPLFTANRTDNTSVLLQQITGDATVPNSNSELLSQAMGLTTYQDGETAAADVNRVRWIFDPANFLTADGSAGTAGHGFLLDAQTSATAAAQLQVACFLATGNVLDPSRTIDPITCTNTTGE
jgi:hypothetical protein